MDVQNPDKILTVVKDEHLSEEDVIQGVQEAGYKAEKLNADLVNGSEKSGLKTN